MRRREDLQLNSHESKKIPPINFKRFKTFREATVNDSLKLKNEVVGDKVSTSE